MSQAVLADAQFGIARVLRPYSSFAYGVDVAKALPPLHTSIIATVPAGGVTINAGANFFLAVSAADGAILEAAYAGGTYGNWLAMVPWGLFAFAGYDANTGLIQLFAPSPASSSCSPFLDNFTGFIAEGTQLSITQPGGYNGYPGNIPIMFSEGGVAVDDLAGRPGYSSLLLRGAGVPMGSRVLVWLPRLVPYPNEICPLETAAPIYQWEFSFRLRNLTDFSATRNSYHLASGKAGAVAYGGEKNGGIDSDPQVRVPIPASDHTVIYNGLEPPVSPLVRVVTQRVLKEGFQTMSGRDLRPLMPGRFGMEQGNAYTAEDFGEKFVDGLGVYQQGIVPNLNPWPPVPPSTFLQEYYGGSAFVPQFDILEIQCPGDEMLVSLTKVSGINYTKWAFPQTNYNDPNLPSEDLAIVQAFATGNEYMGVYVIPGSAP